MGTLEIILLVVFLMWLLGFATNVVGSVIHFLLVLLIIGIIVRLFTGRRVL